MKKTDTEILKFSGKATENRLINTAVDMRFNRAEIENAMFQHSVLCQAFLPYRNPGDEVELWERNQGNASLCIQTLKVKHFETGERVSLGLPYGTKARLILAHINSQAIITQNPAVNVADSMTGFIKRIGLADTGRNIKEVKNQLSRIAASILSVSYYIPEQKRSINTDFKLVRSYDLWFPKDERQRILWSSQIELSEEYFKSLIDHAIPLDERALAALSHNAMGLDVYSWLAQRLHRIPTGNPQFITWKAIKDQFGTDFGRMDNFKAHFREVLKLVKLVYQDARVTEIENKGFNLFQSLSPVPKDKTFHFLKKPDEKNDEKK